jgi:hypothetical protein
MIASASVKGREGEDVGVGGEAGRVFGGGQSCRGGWIIEDLVQRLGAADAAPA